MHMPTSFLPLALYGLNLRSGEQVTILVAVEGEHKLPAITSSEDLQLTLQKLGSLSESSIQVLFCILHSSFLA
jgi:uncharacterized membrane protein